ncbi:MAG: hypothetical protein QM630_01120 [Microbacterium sp.]
MSNTSVPEYSNPIVTQEPLVSHIRYDFIGRTYTERESITIERYGDAISISGRGDIIDVPVQFLGLVLAEIARLAPEAVES